MHSVPRWTAVSWEMGDGKGQEAVEGTSHGKVSLAEELFGSQDRIKGGGRSCQKQTVQS